MKRLLALMAALLMAVAFLAGCGGEAPASQPADPVSQAEDAPAAEQAGSDNGEMVELSFYMMNGPVNDIDRIMGKVNEVIGEKLNAKLNLVMVDGSAYADKMNLMINSGDAWDLCFAASWGGINFFENAAKGAYADLTELIPQYAPETYSRIPEGLWEGVKVNGKIYALVNYQMWGVAQRKGFAVRADLADELNFDWKAMKGKTTLEAMEMLGGFMGEALAAHPDMIGFETSANNSLFADSPLHFNMESVGDMRTPGWIRLEDPDNIINQFETEEFAAYCDIMRDWYNKGYVRKDGATVKDTSPDRKAGKFVCEQTQGWPDSIEFPDNADAQWMSMTKESGNGPAYTVSLTETLIPAAAGSTAAIAINAGSPNIERALQLVELLNTDDELFYLLTQGEEGVDFEYDADGYRTFIDGMYNFNYNEWQVGQSYSPNFTRGPYDNNEAGKLQQESQSIVYEADRNAMTSPVSGFVFDQTPVKTEFANCSAVLTEMLPALSSGSVDPATALPEFLERLKTAGAETIIAEKQTQYDAWKATK